MNEKNETANVIYQIDCKGNDTEQCNKLYIGTTKSKLKTRISVHKSNIKLIDNNNPQQKTALATHCAKSNHTSDFNNVKIVDRGSNYSKRLTLEMLHILVLYTPENPRLNFKTDTINITHCYRHLITKRENSV